jgi:hypothetical protein
MFYLLLTRFVGGHLTPRQKKGHGLPRGPLGPIKCLSVATNWWLDHFRAILEIHLSAASASAAKADSVMVLMARLKPFPSTQTLKVVVDGRRWPSLRRVFRRLCGMPEGIP